MGCIEYRHKHFERLLLNELTIGAEHQIGTVHTAVRSVFVCNTLIELN